MGLGAASGLVAGGVLVEAADWRWIFLVNLPVAGLTLLVVPRLLPADDSSRARRAPNIGGATLATLALLLLVFTVVETDDAGWGSARTLLSFALVVALGAAFAISERRSASPLLPPELIRRRRAMSADAVVFIAAGGLLAMFFFQSLYLQNVLGLSALQTGLAFLPFSVSMGIASRDRRAAGRQRGSAAPDHRRDGPGRRGAVADEHARPRQRVRRRRAADARARRRRARCGAGAGDGVGDR